jgi:hypothetical protein
MIAIEQAKQKSQQLKGTGGGAQLNAVLKSCDLIMRAPGMLDRENQVLALQALAEAIAGGQAPELLQEINQY